MHKIECNSVYTPYLELVPECELDTYMAVAK